MATARHAILNKIKEEKDVLFAAFSPKVTKDLKVKKWQEVAQLAESLGVLQGKPWFYVRNTMWPNWRKRTLAKKYNVKKTGSGGGMKLKKLNDIDRLVLDILGKDSASVTGLHEPDSLDAAEEALSDADVTVPVNITEEIVDIDSNSATGPEIQHKRKASNTTVNLQRDECELAVTEHLEFIRQKNKSQLEYYELKNYKMKLEILELERRLKLPLSSFTADILSESSG